MVEIDQLQQWCSRCNYFADIDHSCGDRSIRRGCDRQILQHAFDFIEHCIGLVSLAFQGRDLILLGSDPLPPQFGLGQLLLGLHETG